MSLNDTLDRLRADMESRKSSQDSADGDKPEESFVIPQLDAWEYNLVSAAIRRYMKLDLHSTNADTERQDKRKRFNRHKLSTALAKLRAAQKDDKVL